MLMMLLMPLLLLLIDPLLLFLLSIWNYDNLLIDCQLTD